MSYIYAMSDIHGYYKPLEENLKLIDLKEANNKLIFCGDYIDYGDESCKVLYKIKELTEKYPNQAITLMGNHEYMFLEFLLSSSNDIQAIEWLKTDVDFRTVNSFITEDSKQKIKTIMEQNNSNNYFIVFQKCVCLTKDDILQSHGELIQWLKSLPFYYETSGQIFVHAGIDEEAEEFWTFGTSDEYFVGKYPVTFGKFYKDIIAGHIGTSELAKDTHYHDIFWDGESHYFIDGETNISGIVPLLKYDTETKKYFNYTTGKEIPIGITI